MSSVIFSGLNSRGSAQVEAALIIPLVILLIAGMIELGMTLEERVRISSIRNAEQAENIIDGGRFPAEAILRGKWYFK